jgi:hypothetical protein
MSRIYRTQPKTHRNAVTQQDTEDPTLEKGIKTTGYQECRFDITLEGEDVRKLTLRLLFYNYRVNLWFTGAFYELKSAGQHSITALVRSATVFLWVDSFEGTSFKLTADYSLS